MWMTTSNSGGGLLMVMGVSLVSDKVPHIELTAAL
jgi:hypothetical protein